MKNKKFNIMGSVNPSLPNEPKAIDISLIDCDENNFYAMDREKESKRAELLAEEIMEVGFRSVIEVRPVGTRYCVIAGETRLSAMKAAYEKTKDPQFQFIPCFVQEINEIKNRRRLIMDNLLQRELTPALKMKAIEELQKTYQEEKDAGKKLPGRITYLIAQDMGMGKSQVGTYQTVINKGSQAVKEALINDEISLEAAAKLSSLPHEDQEELIISGEDLNSEKVNTFVNHKRTVQDDIYEPNIYDYLGEDQEDDYDEYYEEADVEDEQLELLSDHDVGLLKEILYWLDEDSLKNAKVRIVGMQSVNIKNKVINEINKMMESLDVIKEFIQLAEDK